MLVRAKPNAFGEILSVRPDGRQWKYISFSVVRLTSGATHAAESGDNEVVLLFISGSASVEAGQSAWATVGKRHTPFDGPPQAVYVPPQRQYKVEALSECEVAICSAPDSRAQLPPRLIALSPEHQHIRGTGKAQRRIYDIIMDPDAASALFVTEVLTPPGNWSSYPPHKHDEDDPPRESALEELYYYRAMPASGFAFQRIYTKNGDLDETITAHDRDAVLVPRGYHVCAAAAEYSIYYLNVLAGPKHVYHMTFDPDHEWIRKGWTW